jgi:hypothetical protein
MPTPKTLPNLNAADCLGLLDKQFSDLASASPRLPGRDIVEALLTLEKDTKQQRSRIEIESLMGDWRLAFATSGKIRPSDRRRSGFYWPKITPAQISFHPNPESENSQSPPLCIQNQIRLGQLELTLTGFARYLKPKNLLAFDFTHLQVQIFHKTLYQGKFPSQTTAENFAEQPIGKLAFFSFFAVCDRWIAARGKGGGLAIWVRNN